MIRVVRRAGLVPRLCRAVATVPESAAQLSPVEKYDESVALGRIHNDEHQRRMLGKLESVYDELVPYHRDHAKSAAAARGVASRGGLFSLFGMGSGPRAKITDVGPRGIYMYGDVGSGKTMLMDMFYATVPSHLRKRRVHFHAFMQNMHRQIHKFKSGPETGDPVELASHSVAALFDVLCLDEAAVIDVADAMILRHIWETLYADGMVLFMTSNRRPDDLYLNGVQRKSFLPAIELIKERSHVVFLDSPTDYRKLPRPESGAYYFGTDREEARAHAARWFEFFAKGEPAVENRTLDIWGRPVPVPLSAGNNVMQFSFQELCGTPRSAADYLKMCRTFPAVVITEIPSMSLEQRDLLRRFITFLDAAYDSHARLALDAEKPFDQLFNTKHLQINPETNKVEFVGDDKGSQNTTDLANFAGHEEMFAFARALSRWKQMSSEEWLNYERED